MKYEIKVPPGAALPLAAVAEAMARTEATRGGTKFHEPTYKGSLSRLIAAIVMEAKDGRLPVTDQYGFLSTVEKLLASEDATTAYTRFDDEVHEVGHDMTVALNCHTTLHLLNEWAQARGDEFVLTDEWIDWIDERGVVLPPIDGASISSTDDLIAAKVACQVLNGLERSTNKAASGAKEELKELQRKAASDNDGMLGAIRKFGDWLAARANSYDASNDPACGDFLRTVRGEMLRKLQDAIGSAKHAIYYDFSEPSESSGSDDGVQRFSPERCHELARMEALEQPFITKDRTEDLVPLEFAGMIVPERESLSEGARDVLDENFGAGLCDPAGANRLDQAGPPETTGMVAWQAAMLEAWPQIEEAHPGAGGRVAVRWMRKHGPADVFVRDCKLRDEFEWKDGRKNSHTTTIRRASTVISEWRNKGWIPPRKK